MSKSVDSDAERRFFEQAQASMTKDPEVNKQILNDMLKNLQSLKSKSRDRLSELDPERASKFKGLDPKDIEEYAKRNGISYYESNRILTARLKKRKNKGK